jgi:hypothetical protein
MAAFSLRDNAQLARFKHGPKDLPQRVTYDPANDRDPRRQDAAKVVLPAREVSLRTTVRLPIGTSDGTSTLVTWDAWFGSEFGFANSGIGNYKTFQFASPAKRIWFEVRTRFALVETPKSRRAVRETKRQKSAAAGGPPSTAKGNTAAATPATEDPVRKGAPPGPNPGASGRVDLGVVDVRAYGERKQALGPNVQSGAPLLPRAGTFTLRAETWTRYWVLIEQRANDWDLVSLWVGDEDRDAVQIIDRRELNVKRSVESFWLQYNTSSNARNGLGERVGYARNVAMLRNVTDVASLLQRPVK